MVRKKAAGVAGSKTVRRGRPPWSPDLAQVEAAARRSGTKEQIARELGINVATLYRNQVSSDFARAIKRGRELRLLDRVSAEFEINAIYSSRKPNKTAAVLYYLKTLPIWRYRAKKDAKTGAQSNGHNMSPDPLRLIEAMTPEERRAIETTCQRAQQRLSQPEVTTPPPVDQDGEMERLKTPPTRDPDEAAARPANDRLKLPDSEQAMRGKRKDFSYEVALRQLFEIAALDRNR